MVSSIFYSLKDIEISDIDIQDDTYRISTPTAIDDLTASIRHVGLLNPPLLKLKQDQYIIISGYKRIEAARKLGFVSLAARLLPENTVFLDCVRLAISDNVVHRELNLVEVARCLAMLSRCISDPALLFDEARHLGLPGNRQYFKKVLKISQFPETVAAGLAEGRISLNVATELQRFGYDSADLLATLFRTLKINQNKQKEICTHLKEIAFRENLTVQTVMDDLSFSDLIADTSSSNQHKTNAIRSHLHKRRFPHLWKAQEQNRQAVKALKPDQSFQIQPPEYFEEPSFTLHLKFKNKDELNQHIARLKRMLTNPSLDQLFKR